MKLERMLENLGEEYALTLCLNENTITTSEDSTYTNMTISYYTLIPSKFFFFFRIRCLTSLKEEATLLTCTYNIYIYVYIYISAFRKNISEII